MTPTTVDARGKPCPQPVILTRKALKSGDLPVIALVDDETPQHNVYADGRKNKVIRSRQRCARMVSI